MWRMWVGFALLSCIGTAAAQETNGNGTTRGIGGASARGSGTFRSGYPRSYGKYHALLIGVGDYKSDAWSSLGDIPVRDVEDLAKQLKERLGYETVDVLTDGDVTLANVRTHLDKCSKLPAGDNLLIWFAGHGQRDPNEAGNWAWVMQDGTPLQFRNDLEDDLERIPVRHLLVVSDSCFAGVTTTDTFHKTSLSHLNRLQRMRSKQLITSGDVEEVPNGGVYRRTGKRSPFAAAFLQYIKSMNAQTPPRTAWQVFGSVRNEAIKNAPEGSDTAPRCGFLWGDDRSNGQFFFVHPGFFEAQQSREDARKRTRLTTEQWEKLTERGLIHGHKVYTHSDVDRDRDDEPMVLVDKTYVTLAEGVHEPVAPFLVDVREVTVRQFKAFLAESGERRGTRYLNLRDYDGDEQPIVGVTLAQARAYASWAGKQLPDEYQWLAAAALAWNKQGDAVEVSPYPWSARGADLLARPAWKAYPPTVTSRTLDISPWGAERMGTGVREWCLAADRAVDRGVIRGGTVVRTNRRDASLETWRSTWRMPSRADIPRANVGFRCIVALD